MPDMPSPEEKEHNRKANEAAVSMVQDWLKELNHTREELRKTQALLKASTFRHAEAEGALKHYGDFIFDLDRLRRRLELVLRGQQPMATRSSMGDLESFVAEHHVDAPKAPAQEYAIDYEKRVKGMAEALTAVPEGASQVLAILKIILTLLNTLLPLIEPILNPPTES